MSQMDISTLVSTSAPLKFKKSHFVQNYILIWLDSNIAEYDQYYQSSIFQFRSIINSINTFIEIDQCIDFLTDVNQEKVFMIISTSLAQQLMPLIQNLSQIDSIYIFCHNQTEHEMWTEQWMKMKGIFTDIDELCESLKRDTRRCEYNMAAISIMRTTDPLNRDLNELDQSFMYSQLLKDILLDMNYDEHSKQILVDFCRQQYHDSVSQLKIIDEFDREYYMHSPIWWYTRECFTYHMLNRALRTQQIDIVIKMAFFLRDVHQQIQTIHKETSINPTPFTVYRGQGIFKTEFEKLKTSKGGLLAFCSFLSTSFDRQLSLLYAESAAQNSDLNGILFKINVDPTLTSNPFASLNKISYFGDREEEILFSMHTVFRIGDMQELENRIMQVELTLTNDNDQQLRILTEHIRTEDSLGSGWKRLGDLMVRIGEYDKAEEIYQIIHNSTSEGDDIRAVLYIELGSVKKYKGEYENAFLFFEKGLELAKKDHKLNHSIILTAYGNLALTHADMGNYRTALSLYQQALGIAQKSLSSHGGNLTTIYLNMGCLYDSVGEYSNALSFCEKALQIGKTYLPQNYPLLSNIYNCIGETYRILGEYSTAVSYFQKALEIRQKTLPPDHPALATIYNNIAVVYQHMNDNSTALLFLKKALEINQKALSSSHPSLGNIYGAIGSLYNNTKDYLNGLSYSEKALDIVQETLSPHHPYLATTLNNIGFAYQGLKDYATALSYYQKTLDIQQKSLPPDHTDVARTYNNMACCNLNMEDYTSAISLFQKALNIRQKCIHSLHPSMALIFKPMATAYTKIGDYPKALSLLMKALEILQMTSSSNDDDLSDIYNEIGIIYRNMGSYTNALTFYKKALNIREKSLPPKHLHLAIIYKNMGLVHRMIEDYSSALLFYRKALKIEQIFASSDDYELSVTYNNLGDLYTALTEYSTALSFFQKALEIRTKTFPSNHSVFLKIYNNMGFLYKYMKNYSTALSFFGKALEIGQKKPSQNHSMLIIIYSELADIYYSMGDGEMASVYTQLALKSKPTNLD